MILVNCVWKQAEVIKKIESLELNGEKPFKHTKTDGMRIYFDSKIGDMIGEMEYMLIMNAIMEIPGGSALAVSILPVINDSVFEGYRYTVCGTSPEQIEKDSSR
ncbi:hypothetical protein [Clostridium cellulovorans]|uniref:Uncharacterized protein n=1 Tax=Clostridium cellulovorans (strain ATCC 35296 / DSM 3052 / OCM 3 / 743B) TaxID=573061 RepID=D9ST53_CLOC7|nr:hypothetical protein [Clostridium cellulovorans]ADL50669.1 hypothetical protein Clocel_0899 [Clostridium cellulovorans 743B]